MSVTIVLKFSSDADMPMFMPIGSDFLQVADNELIVVGMLVFGYKKSLSK